MSTLIDHLTVVFIFLVIYFLVCVLIAFIVALIKWRKHGFLLSFKDTFWTFFLELLNPFHYL